MKACEPREGDVLTETRIVADARISDTLDALYLTPREPSQGSGLVRMLKEALPDVSSPRRSADGVRISAGYAAHVLGRVPNLDLRLNADAERFLNNRQRASRAYPALLASLCRIKERGPQTDRALIQDSPGLGVLDPHQVVNVAAMTLPDGFGLCVFDEQGAGKTVTFIFAFDLLVARDQADSALIVAPKSMVPEWPKDFARFRKDIYRVAVVAGSAREQRQALNGGADVLVTNFETAVAMEAELKALLRSKGGRCVLAIDESFFIKSLDAKRTRALRRLREWCDRAFVLCGTPAPNAPQDLIQQFNLVDFGLAFDGISIPDDRNAAAPVVQRVIEEKGLFIRHLKATVLPDLPEKKFHRVYVPMEPIQRRIYEAALRNLVLDLEAVSDDEFKRQLTNFFARRSALLQVCSNPVAVAEGYNETPAKLSTLDDLLRELVEQHREKVVVWSFYTHSITAIVERYAHYGVVRYDGQVSDVAARREAVRRFQEDDDAMLFVANPAAAGAGLTLHRARYALYESFSNQAAHYLQSLDRIHRRGQTRDVEYLVLLCDGTLEIQEYDRLVAKGAAAQSLLGDQVSPPVTRESFLADMKAAAMLLGRPVRR